MRRIFRPLRGFLGGKERECALTPKPFFDSDIDELNRDEILNHTRYLLTLSRRRRCACNQLGITNLFAENSISYGLWSWYKKYGSDKDNPTAEMQADLKAIFEDSAKTSECFRKRILLTSYFSASGELEDAYSYGKIDPFLFQHNGSTLTLRDTLSDRMNFPLRVATIISFDPGIRGHRHQIRYFKALLAVYGLAEYLEAKTTDSISKPLLEDELALARGWLGTDKKLQEFSLKPSDFLPDNNFLYDQDKVNESTMLFRIYCQYSEELLKSHGK